ncbi:MAG: PspC domain-containing protein [Chitinophagales bacterium]
MSKRLYKSRDRKLFGVCGGIGEYFNVDPTIIRVVFAFAFLVFGSGLLLYIILAIVLPDGGDINPK